MTYAFNNAEKIENARTQKRLRYQALADNLLIRGWTAEAIESTIGVVGSCPIYKVKGVRQAVRIDPNRKVSTEVVRNFKRSLSASYSFVIFREKNNLKWKPPWPSRLFSLS